MFVPLSERTVTELHAKAAELRQMALTARTTDVHAALMKLARRFDALAYSRSAEQSMFRDQRTDDTQRGRS